MTEFAEANQTGAARPETAERERRQRVLKKAIASYSDRSITVECIIRDLSSSGVKLKLTQPFPIPDRFDLEIPMDGIVAKCEVRWRKGDTLGAVFVGEVKTKAGHNIQKIDSSNISGMRRSVLRKPGM